MEGGDTESRAERLSVIHLSEADSTHPCMMPPAVSPGPPLGSPATMVDSA